MPRKSASDKMAAAREAARIPVTFKLVSVDQVRAPFEERKRPASPYRQALQELAHPGNEGQVIEFPNRPSVRTQVSSYAKELGLKVLFAEEGTVLWVKLKPRPKVNHAILDFIREKPRSKNEVDSMVMNRKMEVNAAVELQALSAAGLIRLNGSDSKWYSAPNGVTWVNGTTKGARA